jgi:TolB-like protein
MSIYTWVKPAVVFAFSIVFLSEASSGQDLRVGIDQLAQKIIEAMPEGHAFRVAVVDFPNLQGVTCDLGRYIASRLTTQLSQNQKLFVIERQQLGRILSELKFSMSDLVDPKKAKQLGKMAGAEGLIVGSIADMGNQIDIDLRTIDIETNRTLYGTTSTISKDPSVQKMMGSGCPGTKPPKPSGLEGEPGSGQPIPSGYSFQTREFLIKLTNIEKNRDEVKLEFAVTNVTAKSVMGGFGLGQVYLVDDLGIRNERGNDNCTRIYAPGVFEKCTATFSKISLNAKFINAILAWSRTDEIGAWMKPEPFLWKNVLLPR